MTKPLRKFSADLLLNLRRLDPHSTKLGSNFQEKLAVTLEFKYFVGSGLNMEIQVIKRENVSHRKHEASPIKHLQKHLPLSCQPTAVDRVSFSFCLAERVKGYPVGQPESEERKEKQKCIYQKQPTKAKQTKEKIPPKTWKKERENSEEKITIVSCVATPT